jgi:hypothetical protein
MTTVYYKIFIPSNVCAVGVFLPITCLHAGGALALTPVILLILLAIFFGFCGKTLQDIQLR